MTPIRTSALRLLAALALACGGSAIGGDEPPLKVTLYPAAEPRPALKYQLLPEFKDRIPGNAAVHYGKVTAEQSAIFSNRELWDNIQRWQEAPLEELRREDVQLPLGSIEKQLERAARSEYCDWQLPIRDVPFYRMLLPEVQQSRQFARLLAAKARIRIARGEFDEAIRTMRMGYAVGQHVATGETLINGLVGIANSGLMHRQVRELIQQPGAPNLYWALAMLPRPLIDIRPGVEAEMNALELSFPDVRDLDQARGDADQWRQRLHAFGKEWAELSGQGASPLVLTAMSLRGYPAAKRALVDGGLSPEAVEAMPVGQVILIYTMEIYHELSDDAFKGFFVPYPQARETMAAAEDAIRVAADEGREIIPVARLFLPAVQACRTAVVRNDREVAVLRVFEALRIHAADHQGQLPDQLSEIRDVPVPLDPVTGQPFTWRREGDKGYLHGPPLPGAPLNVEITMQNLPDQNPAPE